MLKAQNRAVKGSTLLRRRDNLPTRQKMPWSIPGSNLASLRMKRSVDCFGRLAIYFAVCVDAAEGYSRIPRGK